MTSCNLKKSKIAVLVSALPFLISHTVWAADVTCDTTLYNCPGVSDGDNVTITTVDAGSITPLNGYGVYLNSTKKVLNDLTISTSGSKADAIRSNGNNGSFFVAKGRANISATGSGSDGINLGARGGPGAPTGASSNTVILSGSGGSVSAPGIAVRANNNLGAGSQAIIILGNDFTIKQTNTAVDNNREGIGYAVYAGNRDNDISGFGTKDWLINGHRNNNKGESYVFIGDNAVISSAGKSTSSYKGAAVYANKGGLIQLGNNATISAPEGAYHLRSH